MAELDWAGLEWRKSAASEPGDCVEVAVSADRVLVRGSHDRSGPVLAFTHSEWRAFLIGAKSGEFDLTAGR